MLPREYRLPPTKGAPVSFSYTTPFFIVKVFQSSQKNSRFGFVVSKKVSAQAVKRNRLKRQIRAVVEELLPRIKEGYDILFIVQKGALTAPPETLADTTKQFFSKKSLLT